MSKGFETYVWAGEPVYDLEDWAKTRGEKMVDVKWKKKEVFNGIINYYFESSTMPESFWNTLRITEENGQPVKVKKREPKLAQKPNSKEKE